MDKLTLDTQVTRIPDLIFTDMDGDVVLMDIESGAYTGIGGVGSRVWELLEQPITVAEIVRTICSEYEVEEATCETDMIKFISELVEKEFVKLN